MVKPVEASEMPVYRVRQFIHAIQIGHVATAKGDRPCGPGEETDGGLILTPEDARYPAFRVEKEFAMAEQPAPGGYFVSYETGQKVFMSARMFESMYELDKS